MLSRKIGNNEYLVHLHQLNKFIIVDKQNLLLIKNFINLTKKEFDKRVNPESVIWQKIETDYWKSFLKNLITEHHNETGSLLSKKIIDNFDQEIENFIQVCPKEMIDKLENPISNKVVSFAS